MGKCERYQHPKEYKRGIFAVKTGWQCFDTVFYPGMSHTAVMSEQLLNDNLNVILCILHIHFPFSSTRSMHKCSVPSSTI